MIIYDIIMVKEVRKVRKKYKQFGNMLRRKWKENEIIFNKKSNLNKHTVVIECMFVRTM